MSGGTKDMAICFLVVDFYVLIVAVYQLENDYVRLLLLENNGSTE
jgi:hypothetical protein